MLQSHPRRQKQRAHIYGTQQWQALVAKVIRTRGRRCEDPLCKTPDRGRGGQIEADHIIELEDGGAPFDERNIMLRCSRCHRLKTERVAKLRRGKAMLANWSDWTGWRGET